MTTPTPTGEPVRAESISSGYRFTHPTVGNVVVIAIHPLGTIDVRNIYTDRCYRLSGLPLVPKAIWMNGEYGTTPQTKRP